MKTIAVVSYPLHIFALLTAAFAEVLLQNWHELDVMMGLRCAHCGVHCNCPRGFGTNPH